MRQSGKDITLPSGNDNPAGIWSNGTTMWVSDFGAEKLYAYTLSDGTRDADKDFDTLIAAGNDSPVGIWSDETTMWVVDWSDEKVYAYNLLGPSTDATLSGLTLEDGDGNAIVLDQTFAAGTDTYTATVGSGVGTVTLTATKNHAGATVVITDDGDHTTPNEANLDLSPGSTTLTVTVTAQDTTTVMTYTITMVREVIALVSNTGVTGTQFTSDRIQAQKFMTGTNPAGYQVSEVDIRFKTVGAGETTVVTIRENNSSDRPGDLVGTTLTNPASLTADSLNTFTASSAIMLEPSTPYWLIANDGIASGSVRAQTHNIQPDDQSGAPGWTIGNGLRWKNAPGDSWSSVISSSLSMEIRGTVETFSSDATLSDLSLSDVALNETFASGTTSYTASVANSVDSTMVTAQTTHSSATTVIKLGGTVDTDGTVNLDVGDNTITVEVTAEDTTTKQTYTATVTRAVPPPPPEEVMVPRGWGLIPSALGPRDKFRLLFLSSTKRNAMSIDIADYNTFIQNRASAGHDALDDYIAGFRAVGCTAAVDARDNTGTNTNTDGAGVPVYWVSGNRAVDDYEDFYDGDWDDEVNFKDESGNNGLDTSVAANRPFTGCNHNGTELRISGTSNALGASDVRIGRPNHSGGDTGPLRGNSSVSNTDTRPMYGLSQVFEVGAASSDATLSSLSLSGVTLNETFAPGTTIYTADVANSVTSTMVTATTTDSNAATPVIKLNGAEDADGTVSLAEGSNTITVEVTAEDITTKETYTVTVTRDTAVSLVLSRTSLTVGEAGSDTFTVKLDTQPTGNVTVTVSSNDTGAATVSPSSLTFTTTNWNTTQTVTVSGEDDSDIDNESVRVTASATGGGYDGETDTVRVTVTDDETVSLVLSRTSLTVGEAGSDTFTVKLDTQPTGNVTVTVSSNDTGAATVSPSSLTFTTTNWNTTQTVTVSGKDDSDIDNESVRVTASATGGGYDGETDTVRVTVTDDDTVTKPGAPLNLRATTASQTQINLSWSAPTDNGGESIAGYRIEVSENRESTWSNLANTGNRTYSHTGLASGDARHYRVYAMNSVGQGLASAVAFGQTQAAGPKPKRADTMYIYFTVSSSNNEGSEEANIDSNYIEGDCSGQKYFRAYWNDPNSPTVDAWEVQATGYNGASASQIQVLYILGGHEYPEFIGRAQFATGPDKGSSIIFAVRGRYGSTWGGWGPTSGIYCKHTE